MSEYADIAEKLYGILGATHSYADILNYGEDLIGNPIAFSNPTLQQIATSKNYPATDIEERIRYLKRVSLEKYREEIISQFKNVMKDEIFELKTNNTHSRYISKSYVNNVHVGHISVVEVGIKLEACNKEQIKLISKACALSYALKTNSQFFTARENPELLILEALVKKQYLNENDILNRSKLYPLGKQSGYKLLLLKLNESEKQKIEANFKKELLKVNIPFWSMQHEDYFVGLIGLKASRSELMTELLNSLSQTQKVTVVLSYEFKSIVELPRAMATSLSLFSYGQSSKKTGELLDFNNYKVCETFKLLARQNPNMEPYYATEYQVLEDYDEQNGTPYLSTLEAYVLCGKSIAKTAEKCFVHKNTISYRIAKIVELFNFNLEDVELLFRFRVTLEIKRAKQA